MITVEHLTKCYGSFMAIDDLSFEIEEGYVYGFLGPNGAGKSTTMNIMTGCLSATSGTVRIAGHDILEEPETVKKLIGYLPEHPPLYMNETPLEYLRFVGEAKGLRGTELRQQVNAVIQQAGLSQVQNRLISALSKGYRQRVGIAQALLGNPRVIILDEPTVGLDPIQIIEIRDLVKQLGKKHTVIFSSHILSEVQAICEQVLIISNGKLVAFDTPENLERLLTQSGDIFLRTCASAEEADTILGNMEQFSNWESTVQEDGSLAVLIRADGNKIRELCCQIFFAFAERKKAIFEMSSKKASLEEVFLELTEESKRIDAAEEHLISKDGANLCDDEEAEQ